MRPPLFRDQPETLTTQGCVLRRTPALFRRGNQPGNLVAESSSSCSGKIHTTAYTPVFGSRITTIFGLVAAAAVDYLSVEKGTTLTRYM